MPTITRHGRRPNRLGAGRTWIKADLTFQGLKHALRKFDRRVFQSERLRPRSNASRKIQTKYIDRVVIRKCIGASLNEAWFDADVPVNHDLVAVIGNQGSGKSALTDVIALCGQTASRENSASCTLTSSAISRNARHNSMPQLSGPMARKSLMRLDQNPPASSPERVRYIPQGFFDTVTNELEAAEDSRDYTEIKRAIFSHMPDEDRLGESCLNDLIRVHTEAEKEYWPSVVRH